ncbi:MAG: 2'-5' RNA ligase family protein [Ginsengibacter sp.]
MDTKSLIQIPGYRYNEYLLILNPHEELRNKIMHVKKELSEKYKAPTAMYSKPHITLVNFVQFEMIEERILNSLKTIAMGYAPFKVELKDYGSFPSHTIFINIESRQKVKNLSKELRPAQRLMTLNKDNKPHFIDNPHLTVARKLLPWQYEKGWLDYSHRQFTGRFMTDSMLLIKRKVGDRAYQVVQRFEFMNLPVATKQGELFAPVP